MKRKHTYGTSVEWTGNRGNGTADYTRYDRSHTLKAGGKPEIQCSSDPAFRGDGKKYNPEELFVASVSSCHMLWFLHLCADAGVVVTGYSDNASGTMETEADGSGRFIEIILNPVVMVSERNMIEKTGSLHQRAHELCFIANSVNFQVKHNPVAIFAG
jgi:organic hydroperoxide reductase OsmC/OhrA